MKILVIAQHIFPIQTPRAHRTTELIKELSRQGHEVTLYAVLGKYDYRSFCKEFKVQLHNLPTRFEVVPYTSDEVSKRNIIDKVLGRLFGRLFEFPYIEFALAIPGIFKQMQEKFDLLISIADPHHIHWGCAIAKSRFPETFPKVWIADCGDPFMDNDATTVHLRYYSKFEKLFCKSCNYIAVPHSRAINGYYPGFRDKIRVIPQGFDFSLPTTVNNNFIPNKPITFAYAGVFMKDTRNPTKFFTFLQNSKQDFKFIVYTPYSTLIESFEKALGGKLEIRKSVARTELLQELKKMDFLLNMEYPDRVNAMPSKLIDYTIAQRPILSIHPDHVNEKLVCEFLQGDYSNRYVVEGIENYHISNVVKKFISLAK